MALNLLFISGKRRKLVKNPLNEDYPTGFVQYYKIEQGSFYGSQAARYEIAESILTKTARNLVCLLEE